MFSEKLNELVFLHYNQRLRAINLKRYPEITHASAEDFFVPIDLEHVFAFDDTLGEWIEEREEPLLHNLNAHDLLREVELGLAEDDEEDTSNAGRRHSVSDRPTSSNRRRDRTSTSTQMAPCRHSISERPSGQSGEGASAQRRRIERRKSQLIPNSQPPSRRDMGLPRLMILPMTMAIQMMDFFGEIVIRLGLVLRKMSTRGFRRGFTSISVTSIRHGRNHSAHLLMAIKTCLNMVLG